MGRNLRWNLAFAAVLLVAAGACGDDSGSSKDSGTTDGGGDGGGADSSTGPRCGNGVVDPGEQCDDGNNSNADSCSTLCRTLTPAETSCSTSKVINLATVGVTKGLVTSFTGNVGNGTNDLEPPAGCQDANGGMGLEVVHKFHLPVKADLIATTDNAVTQLDSVIYFLSACTPGTAPMTAACNDDTDPNNMNYSSQVGLNGAAAGDYFIVVDGYNAAASTTANGAYRLDVIVRPVVGTGVACDPAGALNRCDTGLSCKTVGSASTCGTGSAPVLTTLKFYDLGMNRVRAIMTGSDTDGDVTTYVAEFLDAAGTPMMVGGSTSFAFTPGLDVTGQTSFTTFGNVDISPLVMAAPMLPPKSIRVKLRDASGLESAKLTTALTLLPTVAAAGACDPAEIENACLVTTNLCKPTAVGATTGTCTPGTAPTLSSARAYTLANGTRRIVVDGGDADGDIASVVTTFLDASNTVVMVDAERSGTAQSPSVLNFSYHAGTTSVHGRTDIVVDAFAAAPASTVTQVKVKLRDALGLDSPELTVPFMAFPQVTASCDPRRSDNLCIASTDAGVAPAQVCDTNMSCNSVTASRTAACAAALPLTLGTAVTGAVPFGSDRWQGPASCQGTNSSGGSEVVYKLTTSAVMDLHFSTDFPQTTVDTVVYGAANCGDTLTIQGCADDVNYPANARSDGYILDAPVGDHFFFVDSWAVSNTGDGGAGPFKLQVTQRPVITTSGTACDPLVIANRCGGTLTCQPNALYTAFNCK